MRTGDNGSADHAAKASRETRASRDAARRDLRRLLPGLWILLVLAPGPELSAEVYTWTDEQGRVHFGDKPREGAEAVTMTREPGAGAAAAPPSLQGRQEKLRRMLESYELDRKQKAQERAAQAEQRQARQQRCAEIRKELEYTASGVFYRDSGDPRNPEIINQGEVDSYRARLREAEKKFCGR